MFNCFLFIVFVRVWLPAQSSAATEWGSHHWGDPGFWTASACQELEAVHTQGTQQGGCLLWGLFQVREGQSQTKGAMFFSVIVTISKMVVVATATTQMHKTDTKWA